MGEPEVVVDASAVLALLKGEPFGRFDPERVVGARISAVNLSEVLLKLRAGGLSEDEADRAVSTLDLRIVPFDEAHARAAARLWPATRSSGLSLGDRACLATALASRLAVVTADRAWARLALDVEVHLIR